VLLLVFPRGGGTSRSGQGAFGNMCRAGRMFLFLPKTWRDGIRKVLEILTIEELLWLCFSCFSTLPGLVFARGYDIQQVPEIPLVVDHSCRRVYN